MMRWKIAGAAIAATPALALLTVVASYAVGWRAGVLVVAGSAVIAAVIAVGVVIGVNLWMKGDR